MNKGFFYWKLALQNLRNNRRYYVPYVLTCIGTIMMFYILCALEGGTMIGAQFTFGAGTLKAFLQLGIWVVALFAVLFLFYTYSFLLKRRKKEFGLYNILGMEKKHIERVLRYETCAVAVIGLTVGILGGILLSKLMALLLLKLLQVQSTPPFEVPVRAITTTLAVFSGIFALTYASAFWQIHRAKPVDLLSGGQVGEQEPKSNWVIALLGLGTLAGGYYIALTTTEPLRALLLFFVAVILVIVGTYCLFVSGSVVGLKLLRKNKRYYYQTKHFVAVSGMIYRMKQNAAGLSSICILCTMVLVMLSSTLSLYAGIEDLVRERYPRDIVVQSTPTEEADADELARIAQQVLSDQNLQASRVLRYRSFDMTAFEQQGKFTLVGESDAGGQEVHLIFAPLSEVRELVEGDWVLAEGEVLLSTDSPPYPYEQIELLGQTLSIKGHIQVAHIAAKYGSAADVSTFIVVVPDVRALDELGDRVKARYGVKPYLQGLYAFDVEADGPAQAALSEAIFAQIDNGYVSRLATFRAESYELFGGLFFLGLFLGTLFLMATALMIYYKQLSEGYDDRARFEIMQQVGMSKQAVRAAIRSQVLTVFFLPLAVAGVHIAFAFPIIVRMLFVLELRNVTLFALSTAGSLLGFAALYAAVYALTARVYYRIVAPA